MIALDNRSIIVTGAGQGLGRAYARAIAAAGARVLVNDIDGARAAAVCDEITAGGGTAQVSAESVSAPGGAERMVEQAVACFGAVDGLVNNAGLFHVARPEEETDDRLRSLINVNVVGALACGLAAIRAMLAGNGGTVINIISGAAFGIPAMGTYGASKGALLAATQSWSLDLAGSPVRVVAMSPVALTRMSESMPGAVNAMAPDEVAPLAVYLLSDAASHLHGQVVRMARGKLSILKPAMFGPEIAPESATDTRWTPEAIARALL